MTLVLTNAHPGGLHYTIATFTSDGTSDVVTVRVYYTATHKYFFQTPTSGRSLTTEELLAVRGIQYVELPITILGNTGQAFSELSRALIAELQAAERETAATSTIIYDWLDGIWTAARSHFVAALERKSPYKLSFTCPDTTLKTLNVTYPSNLSGATPSTIPPFQIHAPASLPLSDLPIGVNDTTTSRAIAAISYPTPGIEVLADAPTLLVASASGQTTATHSFTWYIQGQSTLSGQSVSVTFTNATDVNIYVPIVLLVKNLNSGVSTSASSYIVVKP